MLEEDEVSDKVSPDACISVICSVKARLETVDQGNYQAVFPVFDTVLGLFGSTMAEIKPCLWCACRG